MNSCAWHSLKVFLAALALIAITRPAQASTSVALLGVRSLDGEDELERRLAAALRASARSFDDFTLGDRELSLDQMTAAQGCDEPDARCLADIAHTLTADKLLYGTVIAAANGYELTLYLFDGNTKSSESAAARALPAAQLAPATALDTVYELLRRLVEQTKPVATGTLRITGEPGRKVLIDGQPRGSLDAAGGLTAELSAGQHSVREAPSSVGPSDDASGEERVALVEAGRVTTLELALAPAAIPDDAPKLVMDDSEPPPPPSSRKLRRTLGWVSLGVGAAFAIATVYSWVRIGHIDHDGSYREYRAAFPKAGTPGGVSNVCGPAARGELARREPTQAGLERKAHDLCSEADTLETLQYVFLGGSLLGAGLGTYLLVTARDKPVATVQLRPRIGAQSAGLAATLSF